MNLSFLTSKFHIIPYRPVGQTSVGLPEENERYFPIKPRGMTLLQFVCSFLEFPARREIYRKENFGRTCEIPTTSRGGPEYSVRCHRNGRTLISLCIVTQVVVQTHQDNLKSSIIGTSVNKSTSCNWREMFTSLYVLTCSRVKHSV